MIALFKLEFKTLFKNPASIFYILMPVMLLLVLPPSMGIKDPATGLVDIGSIVSSVVSISLISNLTMTFGFALLELKKSVILKRIGSTSITKLEAMSTFFLYQTLVAIFVILFTFSIVAILDASRYESSVFYWGTVNWGGVVVSSIWGIILSLSLGFLMTSVSKNIETFNMLSMLYFFFSMFLGGLFFAGRTANWMEYVGYGIPHTYLSNMMSHSFKGANIFDLANGYSFMDWNLSASPPVLTSIPIPSWKANLNMFMPLVFTGLFAGLSLKTFKWDS